QESPVQKLTDLEGKAIAIGQPGSATGYYLPLYNLYGLTLAEIRLAPTPKTVLQWLENQEVAAGALSLADLERHRSEFNSTKFRVIHTDSVPSGSILVSPTIEQYQQERIRKILLSASPRIAEAAGYLPNAKVPDYKRVREVIARVRLIAEQVKKKPVYLHE
ncbi:MAG TPA: PhnD/SsuA/transferrin family substrate-binding protein, partial [Coleofasciculaceae cyanobacterium]